MLNQLCYNILRKKIPIYTESKESCIKLMKEIYDRDTRKKFCPPNFWLISEINGHSNTLFLGKVED